MKNLRYKSLYLSLGFALISLGSCAKDITQHHSALRLADNLQEITINKQVERKILLEGGNGKYHALVEQPGIAQVTTNLDTLKVKGVLEGETFALVSSHDQTLRVPIRVVYPELSFSAGSIQLYPKQRSKFVSLVGGSPQTTLRKEDKDNIIEFKWDANNNLVEINAIREGYAKLIAQTPGKEELVLNIKVKTEDDPVEYGVYGTDNRFLSNNVSIAPLMFVHRPGVGIFISNVATPLGAKRGDDNGQLFYDGAVIKINPIVKPKVGERIKLTIEAVTTARAATPYGEIDVLVDEVKEDGVILLGSRHKFYLPYDRQ